MVKSSFFFGKVLRLEKQSFCPFSLRSAQTVKWQNGQKLFSFETSNRDFCWRKVNKSKQIRKFHQNQKTPKLLVDQQNEKEVSMETFQQTTKKLFKSEVRENQHTVPKVSKTRFDVVNCTRGLASGLSTLFLFQALIKSNGCCRFVYTGRQVKNSTKKESLLN